MQGVEILAEGETSVCLPDVTVLLAVELSKDVGIPVIMPYM